MKLKIIVVVRGLEEHAINQVDNKEFNSTKKCKVVTRKVATTEVINHQPI